MMQKELQEDKNQQQEADEPKKETIQEHSETEANVEIEVENDKSCVSNSPKKENDIDIEALVQ
jgi:hypothetical protein